MPTTVGASSDPTTGGRHIPPGGTTQAERSMTSMLSQIGPVWGWAVRRAARCGRCRRRPVGDVLRQHAKAGPGCTQLQKEPYQIWCRKEGLRIRTDGLHLGFVDRREGSVVHCLRETGPDEGGRWHPLGQQVGKLVPKTGGTTEPNKHHVQLREDGARVRHNKICGQRSVHKRCS